jgi:outer membrane protein assembly factor BamD
MGLLSLSFQDKGEPSLLKVAPPLSQYILKGAEGLCGDDIDTKACTCLNVGRNGGKSFEVQEALHVSLELYLLAPSVDRQDLIGPFENGHRYGENPCSRPHVKRPSYPPHLRTEEEAVIEKFGNDLPEPPLSREIDPLVPSIKFEGVGGETGDGSGSRREVEVKKPRSDQLFRVHSIKISTNKVLLLYYAPMRRVPLIVALILLLVCSCGQKATKKTENPGDMYVQGIEFMKNKKYDKAIERFAKVRENFPFDPISDVATVKLGDAYFERKEYVMASGVYEDFFQSHPEDENAAYVLRRLGESYTRQASSIDRDQTVIMKAIERFTYLKNRYPTSQYAKDADLQLMALNQRLADRELYVGEWYYRTGRYNAATLRLDFFLNKYPEAKNRDKALFYLAESYKELDEREKSQAYMDRLKKEYPNSIYAGATTRQRQSLRVGKAESPPGKVVTPVSYTEKKKKEIDLRPPEEAAFAEQSAVEKPRAQKGPAKMESGEKASAPTGAKEKGLAAESGKEAGDTEKEEAGKKAEGKKSPLGFFTEKKPVDVVSDTMEGLEKGKIIIFKGHVIAKQADMTLFCDSLTAYLNEETNEIDRAHAEGNVKIVKQERTATCEEAFFDNAKGEILLKRNVIVFSGADKVAGDAITYYLNEDRIHVQGEKDKKARVTVTPK